MSRRDFGLWGLDLTSDEFAQALAALGVISWLGEFSPNDIEDWALGLAVSAGDLRKPIPWNLWSVRYLSRFRGNVPAHRAAEGWAQFIKDFAEPESGDRYYSQDQKRLRLEVEEYEGEDLFWLVEQLSRPSVGTVSTYVRVDEPFVEVGWNWPLQVGMLDDPVSAQLRARLERLKAESETVRELVQFVSADEASCDLLLLPHSVRDATAAVLRSSPRLRSDCVIVLGQVEDPAERAFPLLTAIRAQAETAGVALCNIPPPLRAAWFILLIKQLSHNQTLDVALYRASRAGEVNTRAPYIAASRRLMEFSRVSRSIETFRERLRRSDALDLMVDIPGTPAEHLGIPGGEHTLDEISDRLRDSAPDFPWDHESEMAISFAVIKRAVEPLLESTQPPLPQPRWIQAQVLDCSEVPEGVPLSRALRADAPHKVTVHIGSELANYVKADRPLPEESLSPDEAEHKLTVVFSEPQVAPEPQVATIYLPRIGDSTRCTFYLHTRRDILRIEARIVVLHRNRILQTTLLRASVAPQPSEAPENSPIALIIESVIRPGMEYLGDMERFDGALLLNHSLDGIPRITTMVGDDAALFSIEGLSDKVEWFDKRLSEVARLWKSFDGLESPKTRDLLWALAMNGAELYKYIFKLRRAHDSLINAQRVQLVAAHLGARFPLEFLYNRMAPKPGAPLCPAARDSLIEGTCRGSCPTGEDEEKVICPLGFWGLNRVVERHVYDPDLTKALSGAQFALQSVAVEGRNHLNVLTGALLAASDNVDKVVAGSKQNVFDALNVATKSRAKNVATWEEWVKEVKTHAPSLLVLIPHTVTDKATGQQTIVIGPKDRLIIGNLQEKHVLGPSRLPKPLVILMGCKTSAANVKYENFVLSFRMNGAALVVGTGSTVLGRHAAPVLEEFIKQIEAMADVRPTPFGEVMLKARQHLLADGLLVALCLTSYGDTDWLLSTSDIE